MKIESVTAHAFGALSGESLTFAPGLTVVVGANESAKSTWHAAIYAALCGRARRRGALPADERLFGELHRPWDGTEWEVSAVIELDDGRCIEIRHDLAGNASSSAIDLQMARDVSDEIVEDGSPSAAVWSGLDRRAFLATACINQAQLLSVVQQASGLQAALQRAASVAGADATAAEALGHLADFQRERVGRNDARSTRPLRRAVQAVEEADHRLAAAVAAHREYLGALEEAERLRAAADETEAEVTLYEAAVTRQRLERLSDRLERIGELERLTGNRPPPSAERLDALAAQVARALQAWDGRPSPVTLDGPDSATLEGALADLPTVPDGETSVDQAVRRAADELQRCRQALELHDDARPAAPVPSHLGISASELLDLAATLRRYRQSQGPDDRAALDASEQELRALEAKDRRSRAWRWSGAALAVVGTVLAVTATPLLGALAAAGIVLAVVGVLTGPGGLLAHVRQQHAELTVRHRAATEEATRVATARREAERRCEELGVPAEAFALEQLATEVAGRANLVESAVQWEQRRRHLATDEHEAAKALSEELTGRGLVLDGDLLETFGRYAADCAARAAIAAAAARRSDLEAQLDACRRAEEMADQRLRAAETAGRQVLTAAAACGVDAAEPAAAAVALRSWDERRRLDLEELDAHRRHWIELESLLGGTTSKELAAEAEALRDEAEHTAAGMDRCRIDALARRDPQAALPALRQAARELVERAAGAEGAVRTGVNRLESVPEAEEAKSAADEHLAWLQELDETLTVTQQFMSAAQEQVQRDLAPVLAGALERWLPEVTGGRYARAIVDLATLDVRVCGDAGRWRRAGLLSHGTAEQIYLLLRVALAQHLTAGRDLCPLLLDDVTVHADDGRTHAVLDMIHEISGAQQVILFTQERRVGEWAAARLDSRRDALHHLSVIDGT